MELQGCVAVVTGGNGGLGQRICRALASAGVNVAVVCARSIEDASEVSRQLGDLGIESSAFRCDVTSEREIDVLMQDVFNRFGRIDILVNDAALNKAIHFQDLDGLTLDIWNQILSTNLTGPMLLTKAAAPHLRARGNGRIVNVTSVAGFAPQGSSIAYAVSKAGLNHLTKCMAVALAPDILVNGVAPGLIEGTRMTGNLTSEHIARATDSALLKKPASKDDIADQVVAMCRTDTMTGQTVVIDSGRVFH